MKKMQRSTSRVTVLLIVIICISVFFAGCNTMKESLNDSGAVTPGEAGNPMPIYSAGPDSVSTVPGQQVIEVSETHGETIRDSCVSTRGISRPAWEMSQELGRPLDIKALLFNQATTLDLLRSAADIGDWGRIHRNHFDWWQFPCDFGSRKHFNLKSENDIALLRSNIKWLTSYRESFRVVSRAFGWDIEQSSIISDGSGGSWQPDKDIRLAKMLRSLWLFGEVDYFQSLLQFAQYIKTNIYMGGSFLYGTDCLDDMLLLRLPRSIPFRN
jgi:hypothetical protein